MRCALGAAAGFRDCKACPQVKDCDIKATFELAYFQKAQDKNDRVLGKAKLSPNYQFSLISEVRPWVPARPGQSIQFRRLRNGVVIIELSGDDAKGGEDE